MTLSNHFMVDRMERMIYIGMNIGYGNIVITHVQDGRRLCITDTGLLEVLALEEDVLITAFPCTLRRAIALTRLEGMNAIPQNIYRAIVRNEPHVKALCLMEGKNPKDFE